VSPQGGNGGGTMIILGGVSVTTMWMQRTGVDDSGGSGGPYLPQRAGTEEKKYKNNLYAKCRNLVQSTARVHHAQLQ